MLSDRQVFKLVDLGRYAHNPVTILNCWQRESFLELLTHGTGARGND
jgi:hypothetical protein